MVLGVITLHMVVELGFEALSGSHGHMVTPISHETCNRWKFIWQHSHTAHWGRADFYVHHRWMSRARGSTFPADVHFLSGGRSVSTRLSGDASGWLCLVTTTEAQSCDSVSVRGQRLCRNGASIICGVPALLTIHG